MIEGHGDDLYKYNNIKANFSSNVYNQVEHAPLWNHLRQKMECMVSYPEPQPYTLEGAIAKECSVSGDNVCVTNGATEAIYLIAQCFSGCNSVIFVPTFSEYADACRVYRHNILECTALDEIEEKCLAGLADLVWICNPNNPTGKAVAKEMLVSLVEKFPSITFVFDQSYAFFTLKEVMSVAEGAAYSNVIQLHSMTKRYAVPGVRLGYLTACSSLLQKIKNIKMPWSVNAFAIETGLFLLENDISRGIDIRLLLNQSCRLASEIASFGIDTPQGGFFEVEPSDTHYMLVKISRDLAYRKGTEIEYSRSSSRLKEYLAKQCGLLVRDASNFATLGDGYFRIATQTAPQNELLVKSLEQLCMY